MHVALDNFAGHSTLRPSVLPDISPTRGEIGSGTAFAIANETAADIAARDRLLDRAMGPRWRRKSSEKLRRGRRPSEGLAFVARDGGGRVVGTVRLWDVEMGQIIPPPRTPPLKGEGNAEASASCGTQADAGERRTPPSPLRGGVRGGGAAGTARALLLGPLAVDPSCKSAGLGSGLMRHAIAEAARLGHGAILLVGDPAYYARFGFSAEKTDRLAMPGPYEKHRFLALELADGALDGAAGVLKPAGRRIAAAGRRLAAQQNSRLS